MAQVFPPAPPLSRVREQKKHDRQRRRRRGKVGQLGRLRASERATPQLVGEDLAEAALGLGPPRAGPGLRQVQLRRRQLQHLEPGGLAAGSPRFGGGALKETTRRQRKSRRKKESRGGWRFKGKLKGGTKPPWGPSPLLGHTWLVQLEERQGSYISPPNQTH